MLSVAMTGNILGGSDMSNEKDDEEGEDQLPEDDDVPDLPQYLGRLNRLLLARGINRQNSSSSRQFCKIFGSAELTANCAVR